MKDKEMIEYINKEQTKECLATLLIYGFGIALPLILGIFIDSRILFIPLIIVIIAFISFIIVEG